MEEATVAKSKRKSKGPVFQINALKAWRTPGNFCDKGDGRSAGLYLQVRAVKIDGEPQTETLKGGKVVLKVTKYWVFRYWRADRNGGRKLKELGIGHFKDYSLQEARDYATMQRKNIREMVDPIQWRRRNRQNVQDLIESMKTFEEAAVACWESHKSKWKTDHADDWINSLKTHAYPVLRSMEIRLIQTTHIEKVLAPIWHDKAETATRVRSRIEAVFNYAKGKGWYAQENPALWKGKLEALLVESPRLKKKKNMPSLPFAEMGAFIPALQAEQGVAARALEFGILTATRSGEIRMATGREFDLDNALWTIPAERMKAGIEHVIPLSARVIEIIRSMGEMEPDKFIFPGGKPGKCQSDAAMNALIKRMDANRMEAEGVGWRDPKGKRVVQHGFRATFKTWAQDFTNFDRQTIEFALAHELPNKTEGAYSRGKMIEKRRPLMDAWASFCASTEAPAANVVPIRAAQ